MSENATYKNILENMNEGVMSLDLKGRVTTFNPAAESILGLKQEMVLNQIFAAVFLQMDGTDDFTQAVLDAIYESSITHRKRIAFSKGGELRTLDVTTSFLFTKPEESGEAAKEGVIAVFSDVTEVEQLRDSVRAMAALRVEQLVHAYRERGHVIAKLDPLELERSHKQAGLDPAHYGIESTEIDEAYTILWGGLPVSWPLHKILDELQSVYSDAVGIQYMHIDDMEIQDWLRVRLEGPGHDSPLEREDQLRILGKLIDAEEFESFLQTKFKRAKRFSLEGAETLIPLLDQAIERAVDAGVSDVVIGMSHRGRLNVLANILNLPASDLFKRFEQLDTVGDEDGEGDVRFHLGLDVLRQTASGKNVKLSLCFNPSHLEFVGPVVLGRARARQDKINASKTDRVLPLIIHGDAAFSGQGIVQEQFNLSRLEGYSTGGAVHVILNNQIGFTTEPHQNRSTQYATDVARMLQIPIFHVNGEQPEAVDRVIRHAIDFWKTWQRDVVIDMYCFRRRGHMELDDPFFTQPLLYKTIENRPPVRQVYTENLLRLRQVSVEEVEEIARLSRQSLEAELTVAENKGLRSLSATNREKTKSSSEVPETRMQHDSLVLLLHAMTTLPEKFKPHAKIKAILKRRLAIADGKQRLDWSTAEALAYASLIMSGINVRLTGQDSERGTFAHRHAVLHDVVTGESYTPLANLGELEQGKFSIYNSPLTESAVLAFEFGYSIEVKDSLVIWEAQFGDFANAAQVIIDQFIASSEAKWNQASGLCLFLPHGLEGQGPEHSSARPERFLQLCAHGNMDIVYLSTASQVFHRLRLQALKTVKRPLIVFTPKRMLQNPAASSSLDDLCSGSFQEILLDQPLIIPSRVLFCSGQFAIDLIAERNKQEAPVLIIRLEQLYPFPAEKILKNVDDLQHGVPIIWVQEEPENMGVWRWLKPQLEDLFDKHPVRCISRPQRVSPATGSLANHKKEQQELIEAAFALE